MSNLQRRLTSKSLSQRLERLEERIAPCGLVPHSDKWLEYWQRWIDRWSDDPRFRPRERMPLEAARAIIARAPTMTNLERRLKRLEAVRTDSSALVPYSPQWFEYWDEQIYFRLIGER